MGNESRAQFIREQWGNGNNGKCKEICNSIVVRFFALFMRITEHQQVPVTEKLHNKFEKVFFFFCLCLSIVLRLFLCNIHQSMRAKNTQRSYCALHSKNQQGKKWLQTLVRTNQNIRFFCLNLFSRNDKATLYCSKTNISFGCTKL